MARSSVAKRPEEFVPEGWKFVATFDQLFDMHSMQRKENYTVFEYRDMVLAPIYERRLRRAIPSRKERKRQARIMAWERLEQICNQHGIQPRMGGQTGDFLAVPEEQYKQDMLYPFFEELDRIVNPHRYVTETASGN